MKQIRFIQNTSNGMVDGLLRVIGKNIFIKIKNKVYLEKMLNELIKKGAKTQTAKDWVKIDIFGENKLVKLGISEIDLENESEQEIESKLATFYMEQYKKGGFLVEMQDDKTN
jgi:hypothetical protein